jgi:oligopeptide transport system ATP-binding protein
LLAGQELIMDSKGNETILRVENLKKYFPILKGLFQSKAGEVKAVDDVSFNIQHGQTFGLVGESGCGKSTLGRCILQSIPLTSGKIYFEGQELKYMGGKRPKSLSSKMKAVFQDPANSINPRHKIKDIILEPLIIQGELSRQEMKERLSQAYELVGLEADMGERYPHMLSGGQQQRVAIARAVIIQPSFIVCDEPVSSLDVSIKSQILNLLNDLQNRLKIAYLFISHDLSVVHYISHVVAVMYLGKIVEMASGVDLYHNPLHPYTRALLSAVPIPDPALEKERQRIIIKGEVPSAVRIPSGCRFHPRCSEATSRCKEESPEMREFTAGHWVLCNNVRD